MRNKTQCQCEQSLEVHIVCRRHGHADNGETTQEGRLSTEPWREQATSGAQRVVDESPHGHSRQESGNSDVVTFRSNENKKLGNLCILSRQTNFSASSSNGYVIDGL